MAKTWLLSPDRRLTPAEKALVWQKPASHKDSAEELRICREVKRNWNNPELKITNILLEGDAGSGKTELAKALSADFGLPYTKITCFADMDKSDVIGVVLPVLTDEQQHALSAEDQAVLEVLYRSDHLDSAARLLAQTQQIAPGQARARISEMVKTLKNRYGQQEAVAYRFYASEIVRAYENGYLLEIQEPTVIRDAAVLMALNSALEPDGSINLPTRTVRRHRDFIVVMTTNRGYNGCRPLNEALRDRMQHTEKMDLPPLDVMMERAAAKTGCTDALVLQALAEIIVLLDKTATANAIKGVAGMRSYFFWVDAVAGGADAQEALYHKVIYKISTDPDEIRILEEALEAQGMLARLAQLEQEPPPEFVKKNTI